MGKKRKKIIMPCQLCGAHLTLEQLEDHNCQVRNPLPPIIDIIGPPRRHKKHRRLIGERLSEAETLSHGAGDDL
jgi:hypothetical protein